MTLCNPLDENCNGTISRAHFLLEEGHTVRGGDGQDALFGARRADRMLGGSGDDVIADKGGADRILGDTGNDRLVEGAGDDVLQGSTESDPRSGPDPARCAHLRT